MVTSPAISLRKRLSNARRVALVGIGSQFRGDDACGLLVADELKKNARTVSSSRRLKVFIGATAPENLTGAIRPFKPDHIILVDAADFGTKHKPGFTRLVDPAEAQGTCFCTHQLPLQIMVDYLVRTMGCEVSIIGIQSSSIAFGSPLGRAAEKAAIALAKAILAALKTKPRGK